MFTVARYLTVVVVFSMTTGCLSSGSSLFSFRWNRSTNDPSLYQDEETAVEKLQLPSRDGAKACVATAEVMNQSENYKEAASLYERARGMDPNIHVSRKLAVAYDRLGQFSKADAEYEKACAENPRDSDLWNDRGYSHYCRGNWKQAEEYYRKALELKGENKRAWSNLGLALAQQGRLDESMEIFEKVIPKAQAHCNIGFVLAAQGKKTEAVIHYQKALSLAPELQMARAAIDKLQNPVNKAQKTDAAKTVDPVAEQQKEERIQRLINFSRQQKTDSTAITEVE